MPIKKTCKKCVLILLDGLGDRAYAALDGQTPLQAARTPSLDRLAAMGANGLYHASRPGMALPSEYAHFAMFGYRPSEFPGRGALEALGAGIPLGPDDVALLAHFASIHAEEGYLVLDAGDTPTGTETEVKELIAAAGHFEQDGLRIRFHRTHGLHGILILQGEVSPRVTDSDPVLAGRPLSSVKPFADAGHDPAALNTARLLRSYLLWAHRRLTAHPVNRAREEAGQLPLNGLVTQRAGRLKRVPFFRERYGLAGISVASGIVYRGLSAYIGLDFHTMAETDDPETDIADRLTAARDLLGKYDFIHVHTKAPDQIAHTKRPLDKKGVIESLDRGIGRAIDPILNDPEVMIAVTADHSTPSSGPLIHSGEPVPLTFCGTGIRKDLIGRFDEVYAAGGALGAVRGKEFMLLVLNHLDKAKLRGLMDTPVDQHYWPGDYEYFRLEE
jgi:2,3-bisphosphoglycerate-independent phosphoglycerate mutase